MAEEEELKETVATNVAESQVIGEDEGEEGAQQEKEEKRDDLKPWEQHSAVISIPRFDYNAPSSLLQRSHSGFLITCPIKREKSATKEAMSILEKYTFADPAVKKRKICVREINGRGLRSSQSKPTDSKFTERSCSPQEDSEIYCGNGIDLSLVKLTRSGLIFLTFPNDKHPAVVDVVLDILDSLESRNLLPPSWCHRIFPIQATCILSAKELQRVVSKLVSEFVSGKQDELASPVKFAVGYNRRGIEVKEMEIPGDSDKLPLSDRNSCFSTVAAAVKDVLPDSEVDLNCPELLVLIEVLPIAGVPNQSPIVAVSVLPKTLVSTKPRLSIKALVIGSKTLQNKGY